MRVKSVSVSSIIDEWKADLEYEQDVDPDKIKRWANECATKLITDEQLRHQIALIDVYDYRGHLPDDYKFITQAAYSTKPKCCKREQVVQWTKSAMDGSGCEFEINLKCPECHKADCSCASAITTIDVDVLWASSHPETMVSYMRHFYAFGGNTQLGGLCGGDGLFRIMRPAQHNFFAMESFLGGCDGMSLDNSVEYKVEPPNIIVNFKEGQIILSYMAVATDKEGWVLVPDHPDVFDAIKYSIDEMMAKAEYRKKKDSGTRAFWNDMLMQKERTFARAKSKLQIPDADEWVATMSNHFNKLKPYWLHESNFNRRQADGYKRPGETYSFQG